MLIQADIIRIILHGAVSLGFICSDIFRKFEFARQNFLPLSAMQIPFDIIFIWFSFVIQFSAKTSLETEKGMN